MVDRTGNRPGLVVTDSTDPRCAGSIVAVVLNDGAGVAHFDVLGRAGSPA